jgi:hypothetical protein
MCRHCGRHVSTPRGGVRPACVYVENIGAVVESDVDWDEDSTNNLSHMFSPFCGVKTVASRCVKVINVPHFFPRPSVHSGLLHFLQVLQFGRIAATLGNSHLRYLLLPYSTHGILRSPSEISSASGSSTLSTRCYMSYRGFIKHRIMAGKE